MRIEKIAETAPEITELLRRSGGGSGAAQGESSRKQALSTAASVASSIDSSSSVALTPASASSSAKAPKWKRDSDLLRRAMSSGKGKKIKSSAVIEGADSSSNQLISTAGSAASGVGSQGVQVEAQDGDSGLVACPHCNRRFNDKAADRHIPICTDIKAKPKTLLKKSGKPAVSAALPARTKLIGRIL